MNGQVGTLARSENCKKTKVDNIESIQAVIRVINQFAGFFCESIRRNRVAHIHFFVKRRFFGIPVNRRRRSKSQLFDSLFLHQVENILGSHNVGPDVPLRVFDRRAYPGFPRQMNDQIDRLVFHTFFQFGGIGQIKFPENEIRRFFQLLQVTEFNCFVVKRVEIVDANHPVSLFN